MQKTVAVQTGEIDALRERVEEQGKRLSQLAEAAEQLRQHVERAAGSRPAAPPEENTSEPVTPA